jgi:hypothetical protein
MKRLPAALATIACALLFSGVACGSAQSAAGIPSATPVATALPAAFAPAGGPLPAELLGVWYLPASAVSPVAECPTPLTYQTCNLRLTLAATSYSFAGTRPPGPGDLRVNGTEIDFFNATQCELTGAQGLGSYTWTLTNGSLHLAPLNSDPCGRTQYLSNRTFFRSL